MATFALGLTKSAVAGTVSTVKSAIEEETNLRVRVQDDLVFITGEFEMMQAFLSASGTGERSSKNQVVRTWVRQLRDLAFDVEDCVEFVVHLDKGSRWDWFRRLASSVRVCVGKPPLPLDVAVADIKRLKARVEDISERNTRYNLFTNHDDDSDQQMITAGSASSAASAATFQVLRKVWKDTGKLREAVTSSDLKRLIGCQGSELQVISLWDSPQDDAIGQLGWKAMVKQAFDDPCTCREFKNRAWVKLTHPFNPPEFLNTLLSHFTSHLQPSRDNDVSELVRQVSQDKYLIVLEQELSCIADWDAIRLFLPDGNKGSRIIVSTRHLGIALACTREPYEVGELRRFFRDQYLYVFFPKGRGHRIGMGELSWQLRRPGVLSVFWETIEHARELIVDNKLRLPDGVEFERCFLFNATKYKHYELPEKLLRSFYQEHLQGDELEEKLSLMSSPAEKIERSRELLREHDWLVCVVNPPSSTDWDLIKRDLVGLFGVKMTQSTRCCILVITREQSVAKYCVDHESRALNARDLVRGHRGHGNRGCNIQKEDKYELDALVGRDKYFLVENGTMSFWGIAGVGKSAVVREMYDFVRNGPAGYYGTFGWVDVLHPFNLVDLCRRLLLDFYSDEAKEAVAIAMMEGQDPVQWCSNVLHESNFLIVFDGLQSKHDWDLIKATLLPRPITGTGIVITRDESIATHCTASSNHIYNIKGLNADAALDLFKKIAFDGNQLSSPADEELLTHIISKCGGLPEIVTAIARRMRNINIIEDDIRLPDIQVLKMVKANFIDCLETILGLTDLFCWMQAYFDACSDELKPCIFYLSVFPEDQSIRRRRLLRRWIAEGYPSGGTAADDNGEKLLLELLRLSILYNEQQTLTIKSCKVNGFFYEYIKSRPMEDNLVFALEGSCSPSSRLTGQHLTISSSWDRDETVFNSIDLSRLRSLTVFGAWKSFLTSEKMRLVRVLDLEGTNTSDSPCVTDDDLEKIGKLLHRLKFLSLRGCQQITRLPDSLGDMRQLQTLDVRYTSIVELPPAIITNLKRLQYIRAGTSADTRFLLLQTKTSTQIPPQEEEMTDTNTTAAARVASIRMTEAWKRKARGLVESCRSSWWELKNQLDLRSRCRVAANGGGVEIGHAAAEGIARLTDMHTLGVVNVAGGKGALLFLKEVKRLTQLRKLGLSGINRENWSQLCVAISGNLPHLESLSLQLMLLEEDGASFDFACFDHILEPPKTLKRLKVLYTTTTREHAAGVARISPGWWKKLPNMLERSDHVVTISWQEDIREIATGDRMRGHIVLIKPMEENLSFEKQDQEYGTFLPSVDSLRLECSLSSSKVTFGEFVHFRVDGISIHCCCSSSAGTSVGSPSSCNLQIAGLYKLGVHSLKEVTVTGTYADGLKRDLREQLEHHPNKPVLK